MDADEARRGIRIFLLGAVALAVGAVSAGCSQEEPAVEALTDSQIYGTWKCAYVEIDGEWKYVSPNRFEEYNATFRFFTNGVCICEGPLTGGLNGTFERTDDLLTIYDGSRVAFRLTFHSVRYDNAVLTFEDRGVSAEIRMERTDNTAEDYVAVEGIEFALPKITIDSEVPVALEVEVLPQDATNKNVVWRSSDTSVVTVENGVARAVAVSGQATIEAITDDGGFRAVCDVEVSLTGPEPDGEGRVSEVLICAGPDAAHSRPRRAGGRIPAGE